MKKLNLPQAIQKHKQYQATLAGTVYHTNTSGDIVIDKYINANHVMIHFVNTGNSKCVKMDRIIRGEVKDRGRKIFIFHGERLYGCGGNLSYRDNREPYKIWLAMFRRCYAEHIKKNGNASYNNCSVSKEWHDFENFLHWYNCNKKSDNLCLDKDILFKWNKIYSSKTCCLVPREINNCFIRQKSRRGNNVIGVHYFKDKCKYSAHVAENGHIKSLGYFSTELEAFIAYKKEKERYIKILANRFKDIISNKVYNALMNYQVEITD